MGRALSLNESYSFSRKTGVVLRRGSRDSDSLLQIFSFPISALCQPLWRHQADKKWTVSLSKSFLPRNPAGQVWPDLAANDNLAMSLCKLHGTRRNTKLPAVWSCYLPKKAIKNFGVKEGVGERRGGQCCL